MHQPVQTDASSRKTDANTESGLPVHSKWFIDDGKVSAGGSTGRWVLFTAAILMILLGLLRGDVALVFRKAATLCLECIGIG